MNPVVSRRAMLCPAIMQGADCRRKHTGKRGNVSPGKNSPVSLVLLGLAVWLPSDCVGAAGQGSTTVEGSMFQVMLGLGFVLALMLGLAWLLRRWGALPRGTAGVIRVIGGSMVGQRERVVLVEVADTWLVIGVAPGQVTALHSMPKGELDVDTARTASGGNHFSAWLQQMSEKRQGKSDE
jgi:flagellar protein FliO/FliZ